MNSIDPLFAQDMCQYRINQEVSALVAHDQFAQKRSGATATTGRKIQCMHQRKSLFSDEFCPAINWILLKANGAELKCRQDVGLFVTTEAQCRARAGMGLNAKSVLTA